MSKEYITDNLSVEDLAELTDEMLRFEKSKKIEKNIRVNLFKLIPAVAMIAFVIGIINILPVLLPANISVDPASEGIASDNELVINLGKDDDNILDFSNDDDQTMNTFSGALGIGYINVDGEESIRISRDNGVTWYKDNGNEEYIIPDPDVSEIEWLNYDEFKMWLDNQKDNIPDEYIAWYESGLENLKNGIGEAGKIIFGGTEEIVFIFDLSQNTSFFSISYNGETCQTYSQEEIDELLEKMDESMINNDMNGYLITNSDGSTVWMQKDELETLYSESEIQKSIAYEIFDGIMESSSDYPIIYSDGETIKTYSQEEWIKESFIMIGTPSRTYGYRYTPDNGGEVWGFGATSYKDLYNLVKDHFDEWIQAGIMTQEEADRKLAELPYEHKVEVVDDEGNIIKE